MSYASERYENAIAVDPQSCGCIECLSGEYVPADRLLEDGSDELLTRVVNGELRNNLHSEADFQRLREEIGPRVGIDVPVIYFFDARAIKADASDLYHDEVSADDFLELGEAGDLQRLIDMEIELDENLSRSEVIEVLSARLRISPWH